MTVLAPLFGLVLAGGRSRRMGQDKGSLVLDGETLRQRAVRVLADQAAAVYVSCREDQVGTLDPGQRALVDDEPDQGPLAGIAAAFRLRADVAWLTLPCDMPGVTSAVVAALIAARHADRRAVALARPDGQGPEPLVALWEPASAAAIAAAMAAGERSPRALLQALDSHLVLPLPALELANLNTPADWQRWQTGVDPLT